MALFHVSKPILVARLPQYLFQTPGSLSTFASPHPQSLQLLTFVFLPSASDLYIIHPFRLGSSLLASWFFSRLMVSSLAISPLPLSLSVPSSQDLAQSAGQRALVQTRGPEFRPLACWSLLAHFMVLFCPCPSKGRGSSEAHKPAVSPEKSSQRTRVGPGKSDRKQSNTLIFLGTCEGRCGMVESDQKQNRENFITKFLSPQI